jgi:hypothetical protein
MTGGTQHQQSGEWEQQRERLSAYLDGEVDAAERAALEQHLPTCEPCQRALAELRQTRALLHALPTPVLPRSFRLPETGAIPEPMATRRRSPTGAPTTTTGIATRRNARLLQWMGGLVAAFGLVLLMGSALTTMNHPSTSGASLPMSQNAPSATNTTPGHDTGVRTTQGPNIAATSGHTPAQGSPPTATATATGAPTGGSANGEQIAPPAGALAGTVFLIGGAGLLVGGTLLSRRRTRPRS